MARVSLRDVTKRYGGSKADAVKGISFDIADGELLVILGPSGCGKTSTLRMIAGLEGITSGTISFDGRAVNAVPPARRNVAMAFENYGLYEHWTVFDNIAYPLRLRGRPADEIRRKVRGVAEQLQITDVLRMRPGDLSGGMRQRIGLARALVRDPSVFLLDEPMSHVDADLRNELRAEIKRIHLEVGSTMIIVTHDQLDALTMADRILVMNEGRIEQLDTPAAVHERPATAFVAGFIGEPPMNLIPAAPAGGALILDGGAQIALPPGLRGTVPAGDLVQVGFRPHLVQLDANAEDGLVLDATVYMVEPLGDRTLLTARAGDVLVKVDLPGSHPYPADRPVRLAVRAADLHVFGADGQRLAPGSPAGSATGTVAA
ncbi:ABC transporter ATP-binding protein [Rhizomonospora bruguierae]|uniref:ABC transporter ATP-binding protein n=1 Tax=Rhizomonospora bruguierae TaxID=1581705 RepID=UPI001BCB7E63|nr:ABC transporter ATP-binding protein [Micromonospora sp. NBRC 107566]